MSMISSAFQDAVHDSQQCFRLLLKAMSEPGTVVTLARCEGFGSLEDAATQTLLTMADNATPVWLSPVFGTDPAVTENIRFHTGTLMTADIQNAAFVVFSASDQQSYDWTRPDFNPGNETWPDSSATVIVVVDSLSTGITLNLSGPGIQGLRQVCLGGVSAGLLQYLLIRQTQVKFPLGVDFIFVAGQQLMCLPRTTLVEGTPCMLR